MCLVLLYCLQIIQADKGDSQELTEEAKKLGMQRHHLEGETKPLNCERDIFDSDVY